MAESVAVLFGNVAEVCFREWLKAELGFPPKSKRGYFNQNFFLSFVNGRDGGRICPLSFFLSFEWWPKSVAVFPPKSGGVSFSFFLSLYEWPSRWPYLPLKR